MKSHLVGNKIDSNFRVNLIKSLIIGVVILMFVAEGFAADRYVSISGSPNGDGSSQRPWDLATALKNPSPARPGDTVWIGQGTYNLGYLYTTIGGSPNNPIVFRNLDNKRVTINGSITVFDSSGWLTFWGLEFAGTDPKRTSADAVVVGKKPSDIVLHTGVDIYNAQNVRLINLIVHDQTGQGIYMSGHSQGAEVYGCVSYSNGWQSTNDSDGHNFYLQNIEGGGKTIADNISYSGTGVGFHIYTNHDEMMADMVIEGNVAFAAGALTTLNPKVWRNLMVGVDEAFNPTVPRYAKNIVVKNNMTYASRTATHLAPEVQIGRTGANQNVQIVDNYFAAPLIVNNWDRAVFTGNTIYSWDYYKLVDFTQTLWPMAGIAGDGNSYFYTSTNIYPFRLTQSSAVASNFSNWKINSGLDGSSTYSTSKPTGLKVFIRPNKYESGRANIVVYNWDLLTSVPLDLSKAGLGVGDSFELHNVENYYGDVIGDTYRGGEYRISVSGRSVALPVGFSDKPTTAFPEFGAFVLVRTAASAAGVPGAPAKLRVD